MKLVLFDIDGTLIKEGAIKFDYWKYLMKKHFNIDATKYDTQRSGKTDRQILLDLLKLKGAGIKGSDRRISETLQDTGPTASRAIGGKRLKKVANAEKLVRKLIKRKFTIGILTGNTFGKAKAKMQAAGLWKYFKIGAFGDSTADRSELVSVAIKDAKRKTGTVFRKKDVIMFGDTVRDIRCARKGGARIIAIATGNESFEQLRKEKPNYLFRDFSDLDKIIRIIEK